MNKHQQDKLQHEQQALEKLRRQMFLIGTMPAGVVRDYPRASAELANQQYNGNQRREE